MKKVKFIVFICLFILLPLAYFNGFIRISDLTSEQESIAKKYGGVYVFDEKLEKEIDKLEELNKDIRAKRSNLYQEIKQELDNNQSKYFQEFNNNKSNYIDMVMQDIFNDKFCKQKYDEFVATAPEGMFWWFTASLSCACFSFFSSLLALFSFTSKLPLFIS